MWFNETSTFVSFTAREKEETTQKAGIPRTIIYSLYLSITMVKNVLVKTVQNPKKSMKQKTPKQVVFDQNATKQAKESRSQDPTVMLHLLLMCDTIK